MERCHDAHYKCLCALSATSISMNIFLKKLLLFQKIFKKVLKKSPEYTLHSTLLSICLKSLFLIVEK